MNPKVDKYLSKAQKWQPETAKLRSIILECPVTEELKWGKPCYTFQETNLLVIQGFKDYFALLFCKGALLKDAQGLLVKAGENTQAARQMRFTDVRHIAKLAPVVKAYIHEAIEAEQAGLKVTLKTNADLVLVEELQNALDRHPDLKTAFRALTPGRQRAYNIYFSEPKQAKTRESRIEKCIPQILEGKGRND